jgi:hypothetical protein
VSVEGRPGGLRCSASTSRSKGISSSGSRPSSFHPVTRSGPIPTARTPRKPDEWRGTEDRGSVDVHAIAGQVGATLAWGSPTPGREGTRR